MAKSGRPHSIHPRCVCPTDDDPYLHPHALPFMERLGPALIMTVPPMLSLFVGWMLNSMNSACCEGEMSGVILKMLSSGLLLGVVCTELVPSMVLELHEDPPYYLFAPLLGLLASIIIVRLVDLLGDEDHPKHKLSLHWVEDNKSSPRSRPASIAQPLNNHAARKSYGNVDEEQHSHANNGGDSMYKPVTRNDKAGTSEISELICWQDLGPALKLLVNCLLDGLVLGTSLVENFDSTGWSLSAAVTLETLVLGMSFSAGATQSTIWQKFGLNTIIASGFPIGVILGLIATKEFQFNTFFFLSVLGFTTGLLLDIVLEDLMREVYLTEQESGSKSCRTSKLRKLSSGLLRTLAFYIGFMWCLVSETQLD
mmetsp:Transcript_32729/g.45708  ORF Transcript_32729/g.45708 Transcript_32729/m.45708 type:complete len:368 (-) Transcript_32729:232-1335(-)